MIYFDNAATTLHKPEAVAIAMAAALATHGNAGRSFHEPAMLSLRTVEQARQSIATLVSLPDARHVAFTSGATESLHLAMEGLLTPQDHVITTVLEHNAVLRTLHRIGCGVSYIDCDDEGQLLLDTLPAHRTARTKCVIATHASNVLGNVTDTAHLRGFCAENGLLLLLDCAQTMGAIPMRHDMADVLCFTGHKALYGPQGTGGIIARDGLPLRPVKVGGTGYDAFAAAPPPQMPDIFEAGTCNSPGLAGLRTGVDALLRTGIDTIREAESALCARFLAGVADIPALRIYGPTGNGARLPIVALNVDGLSSEDVALRLWEEWRIATRPGVHCAPLLHRRMGTETRGMVRFSFGHYNTSEEVDQAAAALRVLAHP